MKIHCLGPQPFVNCFVLQFKGCTFLLDCGLREPQSLPMDIEMKLNRAQESKIWTNNTLFIPQFDLLDMSSIDVVLITNYWNIGALPYLTEYCGFEGKIYATVPTIQLGQQLLTELIGQMEELSMKPQINIYDILDQLDSKTVENLWRMGLLDKNQRKPLYSVKDIESCFSKIRSCSFDEDIKLIRNLKITPISSGYCLGGANWLIETDFEKISFVAQSSFQKKELSHVRVMSSEPLRDCDLMIMTQQATHLDISNFDLQLASLLNNIGATIREGGNVILPMHSAGIILDLFELVGAYLYTLPVNRVPMYFISSIGEAVLKYADISAEWVNEQRQEIAYRPEMPFKHSEYLETGQLQCFNSISHINASMRTPCVLFVGHPSLQFGDITHFLDMWKHESKNSIIFTSKGCDVDKLMAPHRPYHIKTISCPLNETLQLQNVVSLVNTWNPKRLVSSENIIESINKEANKEIELISIYQSDIISLKTKRKFEKAELSFDIASTLKPKSIGGVDICTISGSLVNTDGHLTISASNQDPRSARLLWGIPTLERLLLALENAGVYDMNLDRSDQSNVTVNIPSLESKIIFDRHETIIATNQEESRIFLRDLIVQNIFNKE